ncbi:MAG: LPS export ABC transporter periplasmic protein LptC [Armatimonadota bacterium]
MKWWSLRLPIILGALCALVLTTDGLLTAQQQPADKKPAPAPTKTARVTAEKVRSVKKDANGKVRETTVEKGTVYQDDATFASDVMVIQSEGKVHTFTCTGNPVFTDTEARITGDKVVGHTSPRWAEFTGHVKLVATPKKKENGSELKGKLGGEPTTITSDSLSYDYGNKIAQARKNVVVVQKNRTLWADEGTYDQKAELVTLKGHVKMKNTGDEELKEMKNAEIVTVSLENDWIDIVAPKGELLEFFLEYQESETPPK